MTRYRVMAVAAAGLAAVAMSSGAEAAKRDRSIVVVNGCVTMSAPVCRTISQRGRTYVVNMYMGYMPLGSGVTLTGKVAEGPTICGGTYLREISFQPNPKIVCK
jgi:hypothetical protein